ncbi:serine/threonine-protein kinase ATR [Nematocida major]|uniref:serine/threonine-protein kinase ATR n=1 Tax=Nematocida major TaxID=1912982 RepID=UPI00200742C9|nr:serine/threonine-protein kinase ATR [Nematocida major]KAH9385563.1 serine/threonine-protein kinase ATR [Nematocida major]
MDELFTKEKALCDISTREDFHITFLESIKRVQSRRVCEGFLSKLEEDRLEISETFDFLRRCISAVMQMPIYSLERLKRKFSGARLIKYMLDKPIEYTQKDEALLYQIVETFDVRWDEGGAAGMPTEVVQLSVFSHLAKRSNMTDLEIESVFKLVCLLKVRRPHRRQEYLEHIVDLACREIENVSFMQRLKAEIDDSWPYEKTNPAQKVLLALTQKEVCPYENFINREIDVHIVSPFFIRDKETVYMLPVIFCIQSTLVEKNLLESAAESGFMRCTSIGCQKRVNVEHVRYYRMHRMRIDAEMDKIMSEALSHQIKGGSLVPEGVMHMKKYKTNRYLQYVVNIIKKVEKKPVKNMKDMRVYFDALKHFYMHGENEEYVLSLAKAACQESVPAKIVTTINILYSVGGSKKVAFAGALLCHELIKKKNSQYIHTIVHAIGKKHRKHFLEAKKLILDHFLYRSSESVADVLESLHRLYGYDTKKDFLEQEKYFLAPRLWQKDLIDEYYADSPSISIYCAVYVYQTKKEALRDAEHMEHMRRMVCETGPEAVATICISLARPLDLFAECGIDARKVLQGFSLMSVLFTTRRILEDRVVPINSCIFNFMWMVADALYEKRAPTLNEVQEIILFLVHTGHVTGSPECCSLECGKQKFFGELVRKTHKHDLIHCRYMMAHELTEGQKKEVESVLGEESALYIEKISSLEEAALKVYPYLKLTPFFAFLSIKKMLPWVLSASHEEIQKLARGNWACCRLLIVSLCRMYADSKEPQVLEALSRFGLRVVDALEEESEETRALSDNAARLINMEHKKKAEIVEFFISGTLIPIYYETLDDLLLYIMQELLRDTKVAGLAKESEFITRLQSSKYTIEIEPPRARSQEAPSGYRRGVSHVSFLTGVITAFSQTPGIDKIFGVLGTSQAVLNIITWKKWVHRHKMALLQFYFFIMVYSMKPLHTETIRAQFVPIFSDVKEGVLVDSDILRCIISCSLSMDGVFTTEELLLCSKYIQDRQATIRLLEEQMRSAQSAEERDRILSLIQEEYLTLKKKDEVFGINAAISKLSPVNIAAELKINDEHANYMYLTREILQKNTKVLDESAKYRELFESFEGQALGAEDILKQAEESIQQWSHTPPLSTFGKDPDAFKTFLIDVHMLQDSKILQKKPLPAALEILRERREGARTYDSLRVAEIHRYMLSALPACAEVVQAEKDALLHGVRMARKSGKCELSEKLLIRLILKDDWRVFYEKAKLHLLKNNKTLAKQALQRLMESIPEDSEYQEKAVLLNTEIETSEEIYEKALAQIKTNERLYFSYGKYLEKKHPVQAFKMFCRALECGNTKAPEIVPSLIHYVTDTSSTKSKKEEISICVVELKKAFQNVDVKMFRRFYVQILSRVLHREKAVEDLLIEMALKLIAAFPEEFAWRTLSLFKNKKNTAIHALVDRAPFSFRKLFSDVIDFAEILSKISMYPAGSGITHLPSILGASVCLEKSAPIPAPFGDFLSEIISVSDTVFVFATIQKPKKIQTLTSTGCYKSFLCKANDDLRKDAGFMDLNMLLNSLFQSDNEYRAFGIRVYTVIPITGKIGILEFVENLHTLKHICDKLYAEKGIYVKEIGKELGFVKKISTLGKGLRPLLQRVPPVFSQYFLRQFTHPVEWLLSRKRYTITYAVMNAVGYFMGLGDRHCENILFDEKTGETVHVDLNCIFDKGQSLLVPETVPFRLTQNIIDAFGPTKEEGQYRLALERALKFLSVNRDLLVANLLGFVHDPLGEWTGRNNTKTAIQIIDRTKSKIDFEDEITKSSMLIEASTCLEALGKMYVWWLPFI